MNKLGVYIVEVLNENRQVYLPGLGTLKKERTPALFDKETNSFLAPSQITNFINEKGSSDQLINVISRVEGISEEESESLLKKEIGSILLELNEKGKYEIQNFGKLIKDGEGVTFVENKQDEDLPFYKSVEEIKLISPSKEEPLLEPSFHPQEFEQERKTINWVWPIAIIIFLVISGAFWFIDSKKTQKTNVSLIDNSNHEPISNSSPVQNLDTLKENQQDTSSTLLNENEKLPESQNFIAPEAETYEIIIVSFGKLSEAEKYVENMNAKGYKIRILENKNPGNLYKISYGTFTDESEAQLELNKVRETLSKEAWIYKKKK